MKDGSGADPINFMDVSHTAARGQFGHRPQEGVGARLDLPLTSKHCWGRRSALPSPSLYPRRLCATYIPPGTLNPQMTSSSGGTCLGPDSSGGSPHAQAFVDDGLYGRRRPRPCAAHHIHIRNDSNTNFSTSRLSAQHLFELRG